jgi:sugar lactone lactonase YvrE
MEAAAVDRTPETLTKDLVWPEGPRWHDGKLWFSDLFGGAIYTLTEDGRRELVTEFPLPSGIAFTDDGTPLVVSMQNGTVVRLVDGQQQVYADLTPLFGDPSHANDMVMDDAGRLYVGSMGYNVVAGEEEKATHVLLVDTDGQVRSAADDMYFPNGSVITPDGRTLIVAETFRGRLTAFDMAEDGSLSNRRVWADVEGTPDGICLDAEGAVWISSIVNNEFVRVHEGGRISDRIPVPGQFAICCMLGGEDRRTLFLGHSDVTPFEELLSGPRIGSVSKVRVDVPGAGRP